MSIPAKAERPPRLVLRFAVFTAIGLAFAAGVILLVVRQIVTVEAETSATRHARFVTNAILGHELAPSDLASPVVGPRRSELDRLFSEQILVDGNLLVKLTRADGLVTYSTDHSLIGSAAPDLNRIREALTGTVVSDVAETGAAQAESGQKVLRAYVPLRLAGAEEPGVVVIHQDYAPIADAAKAAFFPIAGVLEALLVILFAALVPIMGRVTSRVRRQMNEIEYRGFHDDLTDLPNRALFRDRIEQAILAAKRSKHEVGVVLIDLDRFKEINDTLGHGSGDALLQALATRLEGVLREGETFARLGGDEFGIALPTITYPEAGAVAKRVQEALHEPFVIRGLSLVVEASMGIATYPRDAEDVDTLIQRADIAMYLAKEARSGYALYDADQDTNDPTRLALLGELRRAIEEEELVLYFQPQAELRTGAIRGVEALVRWQHPERGLLGPHEFIPLAEHTGLIKPLSRYVLESALRQCRDWSEQGIDLDVAVNLTMPDLLDLELPNDLERLLAASGVTADRLELEITESTIMADPFRTREVLDRLDEMGIKLAIDDFGTGYSSLAYLKRLPVHQLKIDRSFVMNMANDSNDRTIVRSTVDLARNLGLKVVAEGVEDVEQWRDLRAFGCDYAQGYFLSKPLPGPALLELVRSWTPALPVAVSL